MDLFKGSMDACDNSEARAYLYVDSSQRCVPGRCQSTTNSCKGKVLRRMVKVCFSLALWRREEVDARLTRWL